MDDLTASIAEDAQKRDVLPSDEDLTSLSQLVKNKEDVEAAISALEEDLSEMKKTLKALDEVDIPEALEKFNLSEIKLMDGTKITVRDKIYAAITRENELAAFNWLRQQNCEDIIKHDVIMKFTKGEDEDASKVKELLRSNGFSYSDKEHVHWQTLRAFVKERLESGKEVPVDLFGVHIGKETKVVRPRSIR